MGKRLYVTTECYPRPGALHHCAFAHRQLVGAVEAGWDVSVGVPNGWYPPVLWRVARAWRHEQALSIPPNWTMEGIPVRDLRYENRVPSRWFNRPIRERIAVAAAREARRRHADVLMVQFALPYGAAIADAARLTGLPYVVQLRGDDVWIWPHRSPESLSAFRDCVLRASLVTGVCRALLREAERLAGAPPGAVAVIPNGIDLDRFRPARDEAERTSVRSELKLEDRDFVIVCAGDTIVRKGWLDLLDALGSVQPPAPGTRIVVLGAAQSEVTEFDLHAEARRRAPHVAVRLERGLTGAELAVRYRAADLFCLPSHWEGLSNALLEAMASGLAPITTAVSGHPEVVTHGVDGWLVEAKNVDELREALREALRSPEGRASIGRAARARAEGVGNSTRAGRRLAAYLDAVRDGTVQDMADVDPYSRVLAAV